MLIKSKQPEIQSAASPEALSYARSAFNMPESATNAVVLSRAMAIMGLGKIGDYPHGETHLLLAAVKMDRPFNRAV